MGYETMTDAALVDWARKVQTGVVRVSSAEGDALIHEVVRLRKGIRKLDKELMAAQQVGLFDDEKKRKHKPTFYVPAEV